MSDKDWVRRPLEPGRFERLEAYFAGYGFAPHRHDTYAIGCTLAGVHRFNYRNCSRYSLPGDTIVLHPDELHDGEAGSEAGFRYRIVYIEPALLQGALGGQALPFIDEGVSRDPRMQRAVRSLLQRFDRPLDRLEEQDALYDLAQALAAVSGAKGRRRSVDYRAAERARDYIHEFLIQPISLDELEWVSGRDRWSLSRDFRALYGTSPYRYLTLRRLDRVRHLLLGGSVPSDAALIAGFSDQSHMTRQFKQAYGLSPGHWLRLIRRA
ncbi:AraC family transcriptional regulator [Stutzerimonas frequens]